jgi:hypothetical protein
MVNAIPPTEKVTENLTISLYLIAEAELGKTNRQ